MNPLLKKYNGAVGLGNSKNSHIYALRRIIMKKFLSVIAVVVVLLIASASLITHLRCKATYENDNIVYGDDTYIEWSKVADGYCKSGAVKSVDMHPFYLISDNLREKVYLSYGFMQDLLPPYSYFSFCEEGNDFIFESPNDTSLNLLYVKEGFAFPNIQDNEIDEVWMSLSSDENDRIKVKDTVKTIVNCAKSNGKSQLPQDIYDQITEKSWDQLHIYLKYKGYPLVEEYVVAVADGRYVVTK